MGFIVGNEIEIYGAGTSSVNTRYYLAASPRPDLILVSYASDNSCHGLHFCRSVCGCPEGWYITRRPHEEGIYYNHSVDFAQGVPATGWLVYSGPFSLPGNDPTPSVKEVDKSCRTPLLVSGAGSVDVNGLYVPRPGFEGYFIKEDANPQYCLIWYPGYDGQPARYYLSDMSVGEMALYMGDAGSPGELPRKWEVYTAKQSKPGSLPAPTVLRGAPRPALFELTIIVSGAGSSQVNGDYVARSGSQGWHFVKNDDRNYILVWYPGYQGQPPRYYIADLPAGELALYYGDSSDRGELPAEWMVYDGPDSMPGARPPPVVRAESLLVTVHHEISPDGEVIQCTGLGGDTYAQMKSFHPDCLRLGDIRQEIAMRRGCPPSVVKLVGPDAQPLGGSNDQPLAEALVSEAGVSLANAKESIFPEPPFVEVVFESCNGHLCKLRLDAGKLRWITALPGIGTRTCQMLNVRICSSMNQPFQMELACQDLSAVVAAPGALQKNLLLSLIPMVHRAGIPISITGPSRWQDKLLRLKCKRGHALQRFFAETQNSACKPYSCSVCSRDICVLEIMHRCYVCQYLECDLCLQARGTVYRRVLFSGVALLAAGVLVMATRRGRIRR